MTPLGYLYGAAMNARRALYEKGAFRSYALGAKTVSIGNLTVGGSGKTPLVAFAAERLSEAGEKVCILTRGYGRRDPHKRVVVADGQTVLTDARTAGDEPVELAAKLAGKAVIIADRDRTAAGLWARERFAVTAFVLDDAFQHLRVKRDLDIVCVDAMNPFGNRRVLPAGRLREPLENLRRADAVVITRANLVQNLESLKAEISKYAGCPIFVSRNEFSKITPVGDAGGSLSTSDGQIKAQKILAFCALGNPANFFEQLKRENFELADTEIFPDHHFYTPKDLSRIAEKMRRSGAHVALTTVKDAVKLAPLKPGFPVFAAENRIIFDNRHDFVRLLLS